MLLVRQLRIQPYVNGDSPMLIEICAGMVDEGDDPADRAQGSRARDGLPASAGVHGV